MRFDLVTLFPDLFAVVRDAGVTGRAHRQGRWSLHTWNPRDYTTDAHRTVDDRSYGGGPGMVMMAEPLARTVADIQAHRAQEPSARVALLSPAGRRFDQTAAQALASEGIGLILVCGRYEGVDQRFIDRWVDEEWSIGDFVLSGGELAAMAMIDACVRLLPGVLNDEESALQDSFHPALSGLLDSPHYTRPEVHDGVAVPAELLTGHHARIQRWRREQSLRLSAERRPDILVHARAAGQLTPADERFLQTLNDGGLRLNRLAPTPPQQFIDDQQPRTAADADVGEVKCGKIPVPPIKK